MLDTIKMKQVISGPNSLVALQAREAPQEGVAPTVERWTPNPTVAGSNPVALTFSYTQPLVFNTQPLVFNASLLVSMPQPLVFIISTPDFSTPI